MKLTDDLELVVPVDELEKAIDRVAVRLNVELLNTQPLFVCVMNGGLPFTWDLMRRVNLDLEFDFVRARRYTETTGGELTVERELTCDLSGKTVEIAG